VTLSHDLIATQLLKTMDWYGQDLREGRFMKQEWILFHTNFVLHNADHIHDYSMQEEVIKQMIDIKFPYLPTTSIQPNNTHCDYNYYKYNNPGDYHDKFDDTFDNNSDDYPDDETVYDIFDDPFADIFNDILDNEKRSRRFRRHF
jgi:hypothetical protein